MRWSRETPFSWKIFWVFGRNFGVKLPGLNYFAKKGIQIEYYIPNRLLHLVINYLSDANPFLSFSIKHLSPIHSTVNIDADVGEIDIKAIVALDENQKPILKSLDVDELKNTKIHISGLNIFTPLANLVADIFVKDFNSKARELLDGLLKDVLGKEIANIKGLPIG